MGACRSSEWLTHSCLCYKSCKSTVQNRQKGEKNSVQRLLCAALPKPWTAIAETYKNACKTSTLLNTANLCALCGCKLIISLLQDIQSPLSQKNPVDLTGKNYNRDCALKIKTKIRQRNTPHITNKGNLINPTTVFITFFIVLGMREGWGVGFCICHLRSRFGSRTNYIT